PETAETLNALAALYYYMGQYAKAEPLYQRALKIREKAFGSNNPKTAYSLNDLGALYVAQDDYAKAEKLFQRALKIREKSLGADHPDTAVTMQNLAATYRDMRSEEHTSELQSR